MSGRKVDQASCVVDAAMNALREAFAPASNPLGGGTTAVRFFAGDAAPLAAWNAHAGECGCGEPFIWVRLVRRYRTGEAFPAPYAGASPCGMPTAVAVEVGIARCAVVDAEPCWADYENEAEVSLDDSWRLELAMCRMQSLVTSQGCGVSFAQDVETPYGPEGGITAWVCTVYVQLD